MLPSRQMAADFSGTIVLLLIRRKEETINMAEVDFVVVEVLFKTPEETSKVEEVHAAYEANPTQILIQTSATFVRKDHARRKTAELNNKCLIKCTHKLLAMTTAFKTQMLLSTPLEILVTTSLTRPLTTTQLNLFFVLWSTRVPVSICQISVHFSKIKDLMKKVHILLLASQATKSTWKPSETLKSLTLSVKS